MTEVYAGCQNTSEGRGVENLFCIDLLSLLLFRNGYE
jgi:hypothetical protein